MNEPTYAPRFEVRLSGVTLAADLAEHVTDLVVETDLDLAGSFGMTLRGTGTLLDSALLDVGKTVEIHLGYGNRLEPAILGEIASIEPSFPQDGAPTIQVSGYDRSYRMRRSQPEPTEYVMLNDSVIAARIAVENGLVPVVDPTPGVVKKVTQTESDMAFLKSRAERYFFDVYVDWDRLHFQLPRPQLAAHILEWGRNLASFSPRLSTAGLAGLQVIRGYNQELAQEIYVAALAVDLDVEDLLERLGASATDLLGALVRKGTRHGTVDNPLEAATLARALLAHLLEGMYEGTGSCIGTPDLRAGAYVEIRGVGRRFGGTYRVRKVTHRIGGGGFATDFSITQRGHTSLLGLLREQVVVQPSPTTPQKFYGVTVAEVVENNELATVPPEAPIGRVKVRFPALGGDFTSRWAPCARPMAGDGTGFYAVPEEKEQVLVAFEDGDIDRPYVIGSLWSVEQPPPADNADGTNSKRVIRSRAGHTITFDDTEAAPALVLEDGSGSVVRLDASDGSITISAGGDLTIEAANTLTLKAAGVRSLVMDANNVDVT